VCIRAGSRHSKTLQRLLSLTDIYLPLHFPLMKPENNQINIELTEDIAEGTYANLAMIAHSNSEFVLDFIRLMPGMPKAKVQSRIIVTPEHAKRLLLALKENIDKYEETFGPIKRVDEGIRFPMNFGGTMGEA
jgi:hypothetical protein